MSKNTLYLGQSANFDDLNNVSITSIADGQLIKWSASAGKWVNYTPSNTVTPGGSNYQVQYNNSGALGGSSVLGIDTSNSYYPVLKASTPGLVSYPANLFGTANTGLLIHNRRIAGREMLAQRTYGDLYELQPFTGIRNILKVTPVVGSNGFSFVGCAPTVIGTATAQTPSTSSGVMNNFINVQLSTANAVSSQAGMDFGSAFLLPYQGGTENLPAFNGFYFVARFYLNRNSSNGSAFFGLTANAITAGASSSSLLNAIGFGFDNSDSIMSFYTADASTNQKFDIGSSVMTLSGSRGSFQDGNWFEVRIGSSYQSGDGLFSAYIKNLTTGDFAYTTTNVSGISNIIPAATLLAPRLVVNTSPSTANTNYMKLCSAYLELP